MAQKGYGAGLVQKCCAGVHFQGSEYLGDWDEYRLVLVIRDLKPAHMLIKSVMMWLLVAAADPSFRLIAPFVPEDRRVCIIALQVGSGTR